MKKLVTLEEFKALNVGFVLDEGKLKIKIFAILKIFHFGFFFQV